MDVSNLITSQQPISKVENHNLKEKENTRTKNQTEE
jgi:hypothetical protein